MNIAFGIALQKNPVKARLQNSCFSFSSHVAPITKYIRILGQVS